MENSDTHTNSGADLEGLSLADQKQEIMWRKWFECCFDKNGRYIEENEKVFNEFMERQNSNNVNSKEVTSSTKQKDSSELTF